MNQEGKRLREEDSHEDPRDESKRVKEDPINELVSNVCKDLRKIGETSNLETQVEDMSYISNPIVVEFENLDKLRNSVLSTLNAIVIEQPQKIPSLSALILICNAKNFLVPKYVIEYFHTKIQGYLNLEEAADNLNNIKNITKFLCCLAPIIEDNNLGDILKQFLDAATNLASKNDLIADEIYYNTLICLPYLLTNDKNTGIVDELIAIAQEYTPQATSADLYAPFTTKFGNAEVPYAPQKLIDLILPSLAALKEDNYATLSKLFIDYRALIDPIIDESLKSNTISNELIKHKLPKLSFNLDSLSGYKPTVSSKIDSLWHSSPRYAFEVYSHTNSFETMPKIATYEGLLFRDVCSDLITNLSFNKNEVAVQLSILDLYFNRDLFAPPGLSVDKLQEINSDNQSGENNPPLSTWKIEDITIESTLSLIFQLPVSIDLDVYYYTVLIACCKENPESIAPVFGRAIRFLYNNLESLDFETRAKYMDWMTIQISNFEFSWKWDEWVDDSKKFASLKFHPKKLFIKNFITKELKLANKKKIKESFITFDPETSEVKELDEFFKYLNLSIVPNDSKFIINYDSEIFGNDPEIKEVIAKLQFERKEVLTINSSPQSEMFFVFNNEKLPYFNECDKFYKFLLSNNKSNKDFFDIIEEVKNDITNDNINKTKFIVNLVIQSYCSIGSRSIYSTISIMSRDLAKLKWVSGIELGDQDYVGSSEDFRFPDVGVSFGEGADSLILQQYIIESVFRIWVNQPQVIFLVLEFLVDSRILSFSSLVEKVVDVETNYIIDNINCFETIQRLLTTQVKRVLVADNEDDKKKHTGVLSKDLTVFSGKIVANLNDLLVKLSIKDDEKISIDTLPEDADTEITTRIDLQYLLFDYIDLFKFVVRKFPSEVSVDGISNIQLKEELGAFVAQKL